VSPSWHPSPRSLPPATGLATAGSFWPPLEPSTPEDLAQISLAPSLLVAPRTLTSLSRAGAETTSSPTEPVLLCLMRYRLRSMRTACYDSRVDWIGMPDSKLPRSSHRRPNRDRIATHFDLGNCDPRHSPSPAIAILGNCDPRVIATPSIFAPDGHPAQTLGVRKLVSRN
jgi:hypothetical protein